MQFTKTMLIRYPRQRHSAEACLNMAVIQTHEQSMVVDIDFTADSARSAIKMARQRSRHFKEMINPTVERKVEDLIAELRLKYGGADGSAILRRSFTLPR